MADADNGRGWDSVLTVDEVLLEHGVLLLGLGGVGVDIRLQDDVWAQIADAAAILDVHDLQTQGKLKLSQTALFRPATAVTAWHTHQRMQQRRCHFADAVHTQASKLCHAGADAASLS